MSLSTLARRRSRDTVVDPAFMPGAPDDDGAPKDKFDALTRYIPTETITIFVAAMGAMTAIGTFFPDFTRWNLYEICAALTPLIFWAVAFGRHRQANDGTAFRFALWEPTAAMIAFLVWALSVPGLLTDHSEQTLAAMGAVIVSTLLSLLAPMFAPQPRNQPITKGV